MRGSTVGTCLRCGKEFVGQRTKRYCTPKCMRLDAARRRRASARAQRPVEWPQVGSTPGNCIQCGAAFVGHRDKRFCSARCYQRWKYWQDPKSARAKHKRLRSRNADRLREKRRANYPRKKNYFKAWRQANRDKTREYNRRFRRKDPEHYLELLRAHYARNSQRRLASSKAWRLRNPDRNASLSAAYRARALQAPGSHTFAEWRRLLERYGHKCVYCGRTDVPLTRDHIVPLSAGGSNDISNIVPACLRCNQTKGGRALDVFVRRSQGKGS